MTASCLDEEAAEVSVNIPRLEALAAMIHGEDGSPRLSDWEKFCVLTSSPDDLEACLDASHAPSSIERVARAIEMNQSLTPFEKFCLATTTAEQLESCLRSAATTSTTDRQHLAQLARSIQGFRGKFFRFQYALMPTMR